MQKLTILVVLFLICSTALAAETNNTLAVNKTDKEILKSIKANKPKPTFETDNTVVFVLFRFGAWDRVAHNNTRAVAPLYVYVYSKEQVKITWWTESNKMNGTLQGSWGLLGTIGNRGLRDTIYLQIEVNGLTKTLRIPLVKSIEEKKEEEVITFKKSVIERHAQVAIVLAVFAIITAYVLKRKTLLLNPFNAINLVFTAGLTAGLAYYLEYVRTDSTFWLAFVFTASEFVSYRLFSAGRTVWFIQILPSVRKVLIEEGVLYRCREGLAYAIQSVDEAIKRLRGRHILLKDKEVGEIGKFSEDKMFKVIFNEIDWCDAILTLSAKIRRLKHDKVEKAD